jgi:hypothetical protein
MDYPAVPFILESTRTRRDPVLMSTSRGGQPKTRRLYDRPRQTFNIVHRGLSDAQMQAVDDFLAANRMTAFVIYWPCKKTGVAYSVLESDGEHEWSKPEGRWTTKIAVVEA